MASMTPSAGGQYHYVSELAPHRWRRPLSYCSGWMLAISWQSNVVVDCYIISNIIEAVVSLNNPTYEPKAWSTALLTTFIVIVIGAFNIFAASHLPSAEGIFTTFHIFALVPVCVTLWVMVSPKVSLSDVFLHFKDYTHSWPSTGLSVLVGQTTAIFSTIRCDAAAHMAEEIQRSDEVVPYGMVWSFILNMPLTFAMLLTYVFNIGSVDEVVRAPYAFIHVFHNAIQNPSATTPFVALILLLMTMITISTIAAASRKIFVFARQRGLPFSQWTSQVSPRFGHPVNAIMLTAAFTTVLTMIDMGSHFNFDTMVSLAASSHMATYVLSIGCIALRRVRRESLPQASWPLGKFGLPINCVALLYASWSFFWPLWPVYRQAKSSNFNWAIVFLFGWMSLAGLYYWRGAKKSYKAPISTTRQWMNRW